MIYSSRKDTTKYIIKKYFKKSENVLFAEQLFIAHVIINWIFSATRNPGVVKSFMDDLEKYLNGDTQQNWIQAIIKKKGTRTQNDYKEHEERKGRRTTKEKRRTIAAK